MEKKLRIEGENRINIEVCVEDLARRYDVSEKTALQWFCTAIMYNVVFAELDNQIGYLLETDVLKR